MPVYTPHGLKLKFDNGFLFGLLSRLEPDYHPKDTLLLTEIITLLPNVNAFWAFVFCLIFNANFLSVLIFVFIVHLITKIMKLIGFYFIPGLFTLGKVSKIFMTFFFDSILVIIVGLIWADWKIVLAFFLGRQSSAMLMFIAEILYGKYSMKKYGEYITQIERCFIHAFQYHAVLINVSTELEISEEEANRALVTEAHYNFYIEKSKRPIKSI